MTQTATNKEWLKKVPSQLQTLMAELEATATSILKADTPYHTVRIAEAYFTESGNYSGRVLGWVISAVTQVGWEYEGATCDRHGTMHLMFKNPYCFS